MAKGVTTSGFEFDIDPVLLNDAEFLELFLAVQDGDNNKVYKLIEAALGKEQKQRLYAHIRDKNGRVLNDKLVEEFGEIFAALGEDPKTKN